MINTIAVAGAGTMGLGIAQVAAQAGYTTILFDLNKIALEKAALKIQSSLKYLSDKGSITPKEAIKIFERIKFTSSTSSCTADLIIEAIIEKAYIKVALFNKLALINSNKTIFASNTSSISITAIQQKILLPRRVIGLHFFNPAPVMKLVEIVKGKYTSVSTVNTIKELCSKLNKTAALCKDSPGFIVNRVARLYYLEAMQLVTEGIASFENVDAIMEATGFKMGPFKLMDLIGMDINLAVSRSIYYAFDKAPRFTPSPIQIAKVNNGDLGRKTGKGFYAY